MGWAGLHNVGMTCATEVTQPHRPGVAQASLVLAFFLAALSLQACSVQGPAAPASGAERFSAQRLPGAHGEVLWALQRGPLVPPLRYRVVVVPGSGCAGMGPLADRYFRGLLHAQVTVLHKPGVHPADTTPAADCPARFVQADHLSAWAHHARAALKQLTTTQGHSHTDVPWLLVGISEGVELLPSLAASTGPGLAGLVMMAGSGLDPRDAGQMQAERLGHAADWAALGRAQAGPGADTQVVQGRSLRYWRDLWQWPVQQPLLQGPWPVLHAWGDADDMVPPAAYEQFAQRAQHRNAPYCALRLAGANHGLQAGEVDGLQQVWGAVEGWGRAPQRGLCASVTFR